MITNVFRHRFQISIMTADALATQGARVSAAMVLILCLTHFGVMTPYSVIYGSSLLQVMACCLTDTKPLSPESVLIYCQRDPRKHIQMDVRRLWCVLLRKYYWNILILKWQTFCPGLSELRLVIECDIERSWGWACGTKSVEMRPGGKVS